MALLKREEDLQDAERKVLSEKKKLNQAKGTVGETGESHPPSFFEAQDFTREAEAGERGVSFTGQRDRRVKA